MADANEPDPQVYQDPLDFSGFQDGVDTGDVFIPAHSQLLKKRKTADARSQMEPVCIIVRRDKKPIPFNFYNKCQNQWIILSYLNATTLSRNSKGTIINATILESLVQSFASADKTFKMDSIEYEAFTPRKPSPYHRQITLDFYDLEDKNILKLSDEELKTMFHTPSKQNKILSTSRLYPRKPITSEDDLKTITSMRLSNFLQSCIHPHHPFHSASKTVFHLSKIWTLFSVL